MVHRWCIFSLYISEEILFVVKSTKNSCKQALYFPGNYELCEIAVFLGWIVFLEETENSWNGFILQSSQKHMGRSKVKYQLCIAQVYILFLSEYLFLYWIGSMHCTPKVFNDKLFFLVPSPRNFLKIMLI